ncbi:MAG: Serine/threonine protein kinase [Pedosphaera sp.]|nr:Serine/threonine protein kinase [Pedosphaera sp.]
MLERRAESPAKWHKEIPAGLCRAVLRCLEKDAGERFANYSKLREALLPYASTAPTPATLGLRFLAGCLDTTLLVPLSFRTAQALQDHGWLLVSTLAFWGIILTYYGLLEGVWSATLGKAIFGLRTVNRIGNPPGVLRALLRALIFAGISMFGVDVVGMLVEGHVSKDSLHGLIAITVWFALLGLTFVTARRKNGFAGIHDMASRTRVIAKSAHSARPASAVQMEPVGNTNALLQLGPYYLLDRLGEIDGAEMLLGYDARLLRKMWIRKLPIGSPAVAPELRNLARPGRLRWLNGKRSAMEAWDAYEAVPGQPLVNLMSVKQSWNNVRFWLLDLAEELQAAQASGVAARMTLENIWITNDGHAKLLDFRMPGVTSVSVGLDQSRKTAPPTVNEFLYHVAISALEGRRVALHETGSAINVPVALHARNLIQGLKATSTPVEVVNQLKPLLRKPPTVSRARRLALLAGGVWFPVLLTLFIMISGTDKAVAWRKHTFGFWGLAWVYAMTVVVIPCLLAALMFRGGALLRGMGLVVVKADGSEASRAKVFYRNLLAWLPLMITPILAGLLGLLIGMGWAALLMFILLAVLSLKFSILPERSLQDRLAGTYLVPR